MDECWSDEEVSVGVLVEVVSVVSAVEKEQTAVQFVKTKLVEMLEDEGVLGSARCAFRKGAGAFRRLPDTLRSISGPQQIIIQVCAY